MKSNINSYEVVDVNEKTGDEYTYLRTYDKEEAMRWAKYYAGDDPNYRMEVREYTLPHPVEDLKGFDDPNSDDYDETIDVGEVFGFYNYEEVE